MAIHACCICSAHLDTYDATTEKAIIPDRHLGCCGRVICLRCTTSNPRYSTYCPYCQITTTPSVLPQGLRDPPAYVSSGPSDPPSHTSEDEELPPYTPNSSISVHEKRPDALHFLHPSDTLTSLSLAYNVPLSVLRKANNIYADNLLLGRRTVLVPGGGESLSPAPVDEEEDARKTQIRRFMVRSKCAEYDVAVLYLEQAGSLEGALQAWAEDERWEREHPLAGGKKALNVDTRGMRRFVGRAR